MVSKTNSIKIAAPAGMGIKSVGQLLAKILIKHGFNIRDYSEYPSLVRGGHNTYQISFSKDKIFAPHYKIDTFFSLLSGHWQTHIAEFTKKTIVFTDENKLINLPLKELANEAGSPLVINTVCLGVITFLYNLNKDIVQETIQNDFGKNIQVNLAALNIGYDYAQNNFKKFQRKIKFPSKKVKLTHNFNDGNEAYGWGFIKGGGNFYTAYPMTPATGVLHFLAQKQTEFNLAVIHPEDEISAANMAAGAAITGARAATGTSGGGFALMNEAISYCGVAEIGMVYYLVSRPGPATGLPTWTSQGDLLHAIFSGHGEFPKIVLAPGDQDESFDISAQALNLAAQLQTPVIVISDKFIAESSASTRNLSEIKFKIQKGDVVSNPIKDFKRYSLKTKTGVSPLSLPGTENGEFLANSYEHDEFGFSTEDAVSSEKMSRKRLLKNKTAIKIAPKPNFYGNKNAKKLIIGWGSTKGPILEALSLLENKEDFAFLQLLTLWPINPDLQNIINAFKTIIVIENNETSQLTTILKSQFNFNPTKIITKNNGRPFFPEEIKKLLKL